MEQPSEKVNIRRVRRPAKVPRERTCRKGSSPREKPYRESRCNEVGGGKQDERKGRSKTKLPGKGLEKPRCWVINNKVSKKKGRPMLPKDTPSEGKMRLYAQGFSTGRQVSAERRKERITSSWFGWWKHRPERRKTVPRQNYHQLGSKTRLVSFKGADRLKKRGGVRRIGKEQNLRGEVDF